VLTGDLAQFATNIVQTKAFTEELIDLRTAEHQHHEAELLDIIKTLAAVGKAIQIMEGFYKEKNAAALTEIIQCSEIDPEGHYLEPQAAHQSPVAAGYRTEP